MAINRQVLPWQRKAGKLDLRTNLELGPESESSGKQLLKLTHLYSLPECLRLTEN